MKIGLLQIKIGIPWAVSLKDKRSVINGLKKRISNKFNVAVSETGDLDFKNSSEISIVTVSHSAAHNDKVLSSVVNYTQMYKDIDLVDYRTEQL